MSSCIISAYVSYTIKKLLACLLAELYNLRFCGERRFGGMSDVLSAVEHAECESGEEVT